MGTSEGTWLAKDEFMLFDAVLKCPIPVCRLGTWLTPPSNIMESGKTDPYRGRASLKVGCTVWLKSESSGKVLDVIIRS